MKEISDFHHASGLQRCGGQYTFNPYGGNYALANVTETDAVGTDTGGNLISKVTTTYLDGRGRVNSKLSSDVDQNNSNTKGPLSRAALSLN